MKKTTDDKTNGKDSDQQESAAPDEVVERKSELSIYVLKKTTGEEGSETIKYDVGVNGRTYIVDGDRASALEQIGEILDGME